MGDSFADLAFVQDRDPTVWLTVDGIACIPSAFQGMVTVRGQNVFPDKAKCRQSLNLNNLALC
jgi:hypothetical protein